MRDIRYEKRNANAKCEIRSEMRNANAKCKARCEMRMRNANAECKCECEARCKMQDARCKRCKRVLDSEFRSSETSGRDCNAWEALNGDCGLVSTGFDAVYGDCGDVSTALHDDCGLVSTASATVGMLAQAMWRRLSMLQETSLLMQQAQERRVHCGILRPLGF